MSDKFRMLQQQLSFRRWLESERAEQDMAGKMDFCEDCPNKSVDNTCTVDHHTRAETNACANNYIKLGGIQ